MHTKEEDLGEKTAVHCRQQPPAFVKNKVSARGLGRHPIVPIFAKSLHGIYTQFQDPKATWEQ